MIRVETARDLLDWMRPKPELVQFIHAMVGETDDPTMAGAIVSDPGQFASEYCDWINAGRPATGFLDRDSSLDLDWDCAKTAFLAQDVAGIGHSMKVRERIGGADRAIAVREDALAERQLDS